MKIVVWHGEYRSVFYVVDEEAADDEQPAVVASFFRRDDAEAFMLGMGASPPTTGCTEDEHEGGVAG